ncbi:MAG: response regulator [Bacteroidetes bacterium]|nr:response regulator [Bacteroidota bacterium]
MYQQEQKDIIKVATVEDSAVVSDRLRGLLTEMAHIQYVGNAATIAEAMEMIRTQEPDVVILDIHLRGEGHRLNGMSLIPVIKAGWPATRVIMFTNFSDSHYRQRCMELGADHFFDKSQDIDQMTNVIRQICQHSAQPDTTAAEKYQKKTATAARMYRDVIAQQASMLNAVPGNAALLDSRGVIVTVNDAWAGFAARHHLAVGDFAVGQDYLARISADFGHAGDAIIAGIRAVLAGERSDYATEYDCTLSDGYRRFMLRVSAASVMGEQGAMVLRTDVTEQQGHRQARLTSESNLLAIMESTEDVIFSVDRELRYITFNSAIASIVRRVYGTELIAGTPVLQVLMHGEPAEAEMWKESYARAFAGHVVRFVKEYPGESGIVCYKFVINPIWHQGVVVGVSCFGRNVTQHYTMAKEIRDLNESLERKVAERTEELEARNKELEAFSYMVSHDLKSPLRVIGGYASILSSSCGECLDADAKQMLGMIMSSTVKMNALIDGLLRFSKYGRQEVHRTDTDMEGIVRSVIHEVVMPQHTPPVNVKIGAIKNTICDPDLIRQVWTNLISNAVKYSSGRKMAEIEVGMTEVDGCEAYFVRDNGVGFDMKYASKLFEVFRRLHSEEQFEGSGIGLATVHKIIQRHGGRIWADAQPDRGATFFFTLGATATVG